jgi:hypothetical protein
MGWAAFWAIFFTNTSGHPGLRGFAGPLDSSWLGLQTGWPDWADFRPMGDFLLWTLVWKLQMRTFLGYFFPRYNQCNNFDKKLMDYILGDFFVNSPVVDVKITFFCDFSQFSAKKLAFFLNTNVTIIFSKKICFVLSKKRQLFSLIFLAKIFLKA